MIPGDNRRDRPCRRHRGPSLAKYARPLAHTTTRPLEPRKHPPMARNKRPGTGDARHCTGRHEGTRVLLVSTACTSIRIRRQYRYHCTSASTSISIIRGPRPANLVHQRDIPGTVDALQVHLQVVVRAVATCKHTTRHGAEAKRHVDHETVRSDACAQDTRTQTKPLFGRSAPTPQGQHLRGRRPYFRKRKRRAASGGGTAATRPES